MKKYAIVVLVGLLAATLFLRYIHKEVPVPADNNINAVPQAETGPVGAPLPEGAADYAAPAPVSQAEELLPQAQPRRAFSVPAAAHGPGPLPTINADFAKAPFCSAEKSLNDMLSEHGKIWGYSNFQSSFSTGENREIYSLMAEYFSCLSTAHSDVGFCNFVPVFRGKGEKYSGSPNFQCVDPATKVLFYAYAAGRLKNEEPCRKFLEGDSLGGVRMPPQFCREAAGGFERICEMMPAGKKKDCPDVFPSVENDCKGQECLDNLALYRALKQSSLADCPEKYLSVCSAFINKSDSVCNQLLGKLGGVYCQTLAVHEGDPKSIVGQKQVENINKQARKLMGRENK